MKQLQVLPVNPDTTIICGDWHQNREYIFQLLAERSLYYTRDIIHVGDVGFMGKNRDEFVHTLDTLLKQHGMKLYFIEGNHEDYEWLGQLPQDELGLGHVTSHIKHIPRGSQYVVAGKVCTFIGGGVSVDQNIRVKGRDWWSEEEITHEQVAQYKQLAKTDVLITHDAPSGCGLPLPQTFFDPKLIHKSEQHRNKLEEVREALQPDVIICGHYHLAHSQVYSLNGKDVYFQALDCDYWAIQPGRQFIEWRDIFTPLMG